MSSFFLYLTLAKINALNIKFHFSEGGFSSHGHGFVAFLTGSIDLINYNFRSESPNRKQIWAVAMYSFSQAVSSKQVILKYNPPTLANRWRKNAALPPWGTLRLQEMHTTAGPEESQDRLIDISGHQQQSFVQKATYWACVHMNVWVGEDGGEVEVVQLSGTRAVAQASLMWALEGVACQSFWQKKNCYRWQLPAGNEQWKQRNSWQKLWREKRKKSISNVPVSSFQLKENLLSRVQMNSSTKAEGGNHCGAIRASESPSIKNVPHSVLTQTVHTSIICVSACKIWVH